LPNSSTLIMEQAHAVTPEADDKRLPSSRTKPDVGVDIHRNGAGVDRGADVTVTRHQVHLDAGAGRAERLGPLKAGDDGTAVVVLPAGAVPPFEPGGRPSTSARASSTVWPAGRPRRLRGGWPQQLTILLARSPELAAAAVHGRTFAAIMTNRKETS
ncbi:hypothetical protein ACIQOV_29550, partial [Kitasatospora sp. NPDC091257]|uniref:hypothetical protein n=1 Tax=Kitasatospora sp. NPDC091257 TaxID=3364084 RepID=UPI00380D734C